MDGLFREEAVQAQRPQALGTICLAAPLSFVWWTALAVALAAAAVLFLTFGSYTPREAVSGRLQATAGVFSVSAKVNGIVTRALVHQGEQVKAGQVLVEMSEYLVGTNLGNNQVSDAAKSGAQVTHVRTTPDNRRPEAAEQIADLPSRSSVMDMSVRQSMALGLQHQQVRSAVQLSERDVQPAQYARHGEAILRAPLSGRVTDLLVKSGQRVTAGQPILSILPQGSKLQAQLLVPSNAIGFVVPGSRVVLRYLAFPYQRFGRQYGTVVRVSHTVLTPTEAASLLGQGQKATPSYEVSVALDRQTIDAEGKTEPLMPDMAVSADILLGRTSLWEWAFDPRPGSHQQLATASGRG